MYLSNKSNLIWLRSNKFKDSKISAMIGNDEPREVNTLGKTPRKNVVKFISIGCNCDVAGFLKRKKFIDLTYPFDWIWSNIEFIKSTFRDDFHSFTDIQNLTVHRLTPFLHTYIKNHDNSAISLHDADYLTETEYIEKVPYINEKYKRRLIRMYNDEIVLVRMILPSEFDKINNIPETTSEFLNLLSTLDKKFKSNINIFIVDTQHTLIETSNHPRIKIFYSFDALELHINNIYLY